MRKIDLVHFSTPDLLVLLRELSSEIERRLGIPIEQRVRDVEPVQVLREPAAADKAFCLHIARKLQQGEYIKAGERARVAGVAAEFAAWVIKQGLPTEGGTGPWRKQADMYRVGFAGEK